MKKFLCVIFGILFVFCLTSCNDSKVNEVQSKKIDITFEFNEKASKNHTIFIYTSLPVGTLVDVEVMSGSYYHSTENIEVKGDTNGNYIQTESQKNADGKDIKDGNYILKINTSPLSSQPSSVLDIIGRKGEYLSGTNVFEDPETQERFVKYSKPITKDGEYFKLV